MSSCESRWLVTVAPQLTRHTWHSHFEKMQSHSVLPAHASPLICIERALRTYFASEQSVQDAEDPARFRAQMLHCDDDTKGSNGEDDVKGGRAVHETLMGISGAAYVTQLAVTLSVWNETGTNPLLSLSTGTGTADVLALAIEGVTPEFTSRQRILAISTDIIHEFVVTIQTGVEEATLAVVTSLVDRVGGSRGLLTLLGFQQTVGSRKIPPLTLRQCLAAFTQRHTPKEPLMVGARAFSKHCARSSSGWWGKLEGNDHAKNAIALAKVRELLACATWKNIHSLPHAHATMEIRNALGYGARWDAETHTFRGFLEPPMANGHEIKWRH